MVGDVLCNFYLESFKMTSPIGTWQVTIEKDNVKNNHATTVANPLMSMCVPPPLPIVDATHWNSDVKIVWNSIQFESLLVEASQLSFEAALRLARRVGYNGLDTSRSYRRDGTTALHGWVSLHKMYCLLLPMYVCCG